MHTKIYDHTLAINIGAKIQFFMFNLSVQWFHKVIVAEFFHPY